MKRRDFLKTLGIGCLGCCTPLNAMAGTGITAQNTGGPKLPFPGNQKFRSAASNDGKTYYAPPLLRDYDAEVAERRALYLPYFNESNIDEILDEMRQSYSDVIPTISFEGRFNYHLQYLIPNAQDLAEYLVVIKHGMTIDEFAELRFENAYNEIMSMPEELRLNIGKSSFGFISQLQMRFVAWISQQNLFPDESVCSYIKGDGDEYDWGMDYTRCDNIILFEKHDAAELVSKLTCNYDFIPGKAFNMGYFRTKTLADGDSVCDMRWKKDKVVPLPEF